ncbi:hypothetical protein jhhlp_000420 [Lomentospora prolificans]|uniref:Adhesin domain-containing protein n=1 Tax=Lomentospora prolificans TaxID=41688 RepID=A0A2N3NKY2_9PEZI|nr:hypothetical protein jhhlp_000420 [Lomentospora prolificans]
MGKQAEYQRLIDAEPQDMSNGVSNDQLTQILLARERRRHRARRVFRFVLFIVLPVLFFFSFFGKTGPGFGPGCHHSPNATDAEDAFRQTPDENCGNDFHKIHDGTYPLQFSSDHTVQFVQQQGRNRRGGHRNGSPNVSGHVRVVQSSSSKGKIDLRIDVNNDDVPVHTHWNPETQRLYVNVEHVYDEGGWPRPCVDIQATIYVPADAELKVLKVEVSSLAVDVGKSLGVAIDETILTTVAGHIKFGTGAIKEGSRLSLTSISGNIHAEAPLLEKVDSFTTSGTNHVNVWPPAKWRDFDTASLNVHSISGNVRALDPLDEGAHVPAADYIRKVSTVSGNVDAALFFSSRVEVSGQPSGDLDVSLLPLLSGGLSGDDDDEVRSKLETNSVSGNAKLQVLEPAWIGESGKKKKWTLVSSHAAVSGNIEIHLPDAWEGGFSTRSLTGRIDICGKDVQLGTMEEKEADAEVMRAIRGHKGDGNSKLDVHTTTGNIKLIIGKE